MAAPALPTDRRFRGVVFALVAVLAAAPAALADDMSQLTQEVRDPAVSIGGAYGIGQVIVDGSPVARTTLTPVNIGFQLGGQKFGIQKY